MQAGKRTMVKPIESGQKLCLQSIVWPVCSFLGTILITMDFFFNYLHTGAKKGRCRNSASCKRCMRKSRRLDLPEQRPFYQPQVKSSLSFPGSSFIKLITYLFIYILKKETTIASVANAVRSFCYIPLTQCSATTFSSGYSNFSGFTPSALQIASIPS